MREDIAGGLRNALERGETMEQAVRTFVNAGYSEREVRDAAEYARNGTLSSLEHVNKKSELNQKPIIKKLDSKKVSPNLKKNSKSPLGLKIVMLGGALLLLAGLLISTILYREQILSFFTEKF